jgi:hypothetical protein
MQYGEHYYLYLPPSLVIGLYLTWAGFTAPSPKPDKNLRHRRLVCTGLYPRVND